MNWLIIVVLVALGFAFLKMKDMKHKTFLIIIVLLFLFIYTTGYQVLKGEDINWKSAAGIEKGLRLYFAWMGGMFDNLKVITANAIRMDWSPNKTSS